MIPKGSPAQHQDRGLPAFRDGIAQLAPFVVDRVGELQDWTSIKLLTVQVRRLRRWYRPGLLCIGDAAHKSPSVCLRNSPHLQLCGESGDRGSIVPHLVVDGPVPDLTEQVYALHRLLLLCS